MTSCHFSSILRLAVLAIFAAAGGALAAGQEREKPDAPTPQGPSALNSKAISRNAPYQMISGQGRVRWAFLRTFGPKSLFAGTFSEGIGTARDSPKEYGPHWDGFAKRYGVRLSSVATSNTLEAGLGAIWGEDPRYVRADSPAFKKRLGHVFLMTFSARNREGELRPAYARFIAIPGGNFLSNTWRVSSESQTGDALRRSGYSVLWRLAGSAWSEFWPDLKRKVLKK